MSITSTAFWVFFGVLLLIYYGIPNALKERLQWLLLLIASLAFYASDQLYGLWVLFFVVIVTYVGAMVISALKEHKKEAKAVMVETITLLLNFSCLFFLKYTDISLGNLLVPMGISFYVLTACGYVIDVKRGLVDRERNPLKLCLFLCFFPQIIQGPITRFGQMRETLMACHNWNFGRIYLGLQRVLWGAFKKLVIADRIKVTVDIIKGNPSDYTGLYVILVMVSYMIELYADFTGGIDMALGMGQMLGIALPENFDKPYSAKSLKEFWRRWHMSMGDWFKDYLFYPLSTSVFMGKLRLFFSSVPVDKNFSEEKAKLVAKKKKKLAKRVSMIITTLVTWAMIGLWHGRGEGYLTWGLLNGILLLLSEEMEPLRVSFHKKIPFSNSSFYGGLQVLRTFCAVALLRLYDLYGTSRQVLTAISDMGRNFTWNIINPLLLNQLGLSLSNSIILILGIILMVAVDEKEIGKTLVKKGYWLQLAVMLMLLLSVLIFGCYGINYLENDFIYKRY